MAAETAEVPPTSEVKPHAGPATPWTAENRGGLRRLLASIVRLADIQLKIWLTEAKITAAKILAYALIFGTAAVLGILGIIFLLIGLFRILTDVVGIAPVWSFLIFAGFLFLLMGTLLLIARGILIAKKGTGTTVEPPERSRG